jgi:CRISPR-associated protein Cas2
VARRRFLIAYDICDPQRLRQVCKTMESYGERLQYSVFICDLSRTELVPLGARVE